MEHDGIRVVRSGERDGWAALVDPPGAIPSQGSETEAFTSPDGRFTAGLWRREPDTWAFERAYDEVAVILEGRADIELPDGTKLPVGPGDVLITPNGSKGTWHIHETIVKCFAIYDVKA